MRIPSVAIAALVVLAAQQLAASPVAPGVGALLSQGGRARRDTCDPCRCTGQANKLKQGSSCKDWGYNQIWCYVHKDCPGARKSSTIDNAYWDFCPSATDNGKNCCPKAPSTCPYGHRKVQNAKTGCLECTPKKCSGCTCTGLKNAYGFGHKCKKWGGPNARSWCYVHSSCNSAIKSSQVEGASWAYCPKATTSGQSCCPEPNPVCKAGYEKAINPNTGCERCYRTDRCDECKCIGLENSKGHGGTCGDWNGDGDRWCYTHKSCPYAQRSAIISGAFWSFCPQGTDKGKNCCPTGVCPYTQRNIDPSTGCLACDVCPNEDKACKERYELAPNPATGCQECQPLCPYEPTYCPSGEVLEEGKNGCFECVKKCPDEPATCGNRYDRVRDSKGCYYCKHKCPNEPATCPAGYDRALSGDCYKCVERCPNEPATCGNRYDRVRDSKGCYVCKHKCPNEPVYCPYDQVLELDPVTGCYVCNPTCPNEPATCPTGYDRVLSGDCYKCVERCPNEPATCGNRYDRVRDSKGCYVCKHKCPNEPATCPAGYDRVLSGDCYKCVERCPNEPATCGNRYDRVRDSKGCYYCKHKCPNEPATCPAGYDRALSGDCYKCVERCPNEPATCGNRYDRVRDSKGCYVCKHKCPNEPVYCPYDQVLELDPVTGCYVCNPTCPNEPATCPTGYDRVLSGDCYKCVERCPNEPATCGNRYDRVRDSKGCYVCKHKCPNEPATCPAGYDRVLSGDCYKCVERCPNEPATCGNRYDRVRDSKGCYVCKHKCPNEPATCPAGYDRVLSGDCYKCVERCPNEPATCGNRYDRVRDSKGCYVCKHKCPNEPATCPAGYDRALSGDCYKCVERCPNEPATCGNRYDRVRDSKGCYYCKHKCPNEPATCPSRYVRVYSPSSGCHECMHLCPNEPTACPHMHELVLNDLTTCYECVHPCPNEPTTCPTDYQLAAGPDGCKLCVPPTCPYVQLPCPTGYALQLDANNCRTCQQVCPWTPAACPTGYDRTVDAHGCPRCTCECDYVPDACPQGYGKASKDGCDVCLEQCPHRPTQCPSGYQLDVDGNGCEVCAAKCPHVSTCAAGYTRELNPATGCYYCAQACDQEPSNCPLGSLLIKDDQTGCSKCTTVCPNQPSSCPPGMALSYPPQSVCLTCRYVSGNGGCPDLDECPPGSEPRLDPVSGCYECGSGSSNSGTCPNEPQNCATGLQLVPNADSGCNECLPACPRVPFECPPGDRLDVDVNSGCYSCLPITCTVGSTTVANLEWISNSCEDMCQCVGGVLTNCCRERKAIKDMSASERSRLTQAFYDLATGTGQATPQLHQDYETLIQDHETHFFSGIHSIEQFLPWHRYYILAVENLLRQVDCRLTMPYWAWDADTGSPWTSAVWGPTYYGGGSGNNCVPDGPFQSPFTTPSNQCLRRTRSGGLPTPQQVAIALATPAADFPLFNGLLDSMHGGVHCAVGGTMCSLGSAGAPEFFLHHTYLDYLWGQWQDRSAAHFSAFTSAIDDLMAAGSTAEGYRPRDMLNISAHAGVCVKYVAASGTTTDIVTALSAVPQTVLLGVPGSRPNWQTASSKWFSQVAKVGPADQKALDEANALLNGVPRLSIPQTGGNDKFAPAIGARADDIWDQIQASGEVDQATRARIYQLLSQESSFTRTQ